MSGHNGYQTPSDKGGYSGQHPPLPEASTSHTQHQPLLPASHHTLPVASSSSHGIASNEYPSTHQGSYASSSSHGTSQGGAGPIPGQVPGGMPYDDPRNLPGVYPFITYQPVARTAGHFAPMTEVFPPESSSSGLYPQHAEFFSHLESPSTPEEWAMRNAAESRIRAAMAAGPSYSNMYHVPDSSSFDMPTYPPYHPPGLPAPMAYKFLSNYLPPPMPQQPPTPSSNADPQTPSGLDLFDTFLASRRLQTPTDDESEMAASSSVAGDHPSSSVTSTPSIARHMSRAKLDTASPGPSPSKKQRTDKSERKSVSPTPRAKTASERGNLKIVIKRESSSQPMLHTPTPSTGKSAKHSQPTGSQTSVKKEVVVEIPARRKKSQGEEEEDDDALAWDDGDGEHGRHGPDHNNDVKANGDWDMDRARTQSPSWHPRTTDPGSARTGERDTRSSIEKLQQLMEDIFEESDNFPAEPSEQDIAAAKYFVAPHPASPFALLSAKGVRKITSSVNRVQKAMTKSKNQEIDWEAAGLSKLLRLLERSMTGLDVLAPFDHDKKATVAKKKGKAKKEKEKKGSKSPEAEAVHLKEEEEEVSTAELTVGELQQKQAVLDAYARAGLAAECCLTLLDTDGLPKHLLSEGILTIAVAVVKDTLAKVLIPVVEALGGSTITSRYLEYVVDLETSLSKRKLGPAFASPSLSSLAQSAWASLPRIASLLARSDISFGEDLIISTVYLAITPLFVRESESTKKRGKEVVGVGVGIIKSLRVEALGCLRGVFARYEEQRQWIVEEILSAMGRSSDATSLAKFPLPNGSHIHTVSALLLQLIQASAFGVSKRVRRIRSNFFALSLDAQSTTTTPGTPAERLDTLDEEMRICSDAIESAIKSAGIVVKYLVQRSGVSRGNKSSHDTDYKAILDFFVADLLTVLYQPEWPGASVFLTVLSRVLITALEESRSGDSSAKSLALDYLGDTAARLRRYHLDSASLTSTSLDEIIAGTDGQACDSLADRHRLVHDFLTIASREDAMYSCSLDMATLVWAQEIHSAIKKSGSVVEKLAQEKDEEAVEAREKLQAMQISLRKILGAVWSAEDNSIFEVADPAAAGNAAKASIAISCARPLQSAFGPILGALVATMGASIIALRSKALKGLSTIVTVDPDVLAKSVVREAIDDRLSDPSPQVRDAAVELVGKYVVQKPALAADYYPLLALRVSDSGLAVRKRVIKLLKGIFSTTGEKDIQVDICCKMVGLTADTDESIKELAVKTATEMFFPPGADKAAKEAAAALLVDVVAEFQGGVQVLETGISDVARECEKLGMERRLGEDVDIFFEKLSDAMERVDIDPLSHIRAIYLLVIARSDLIDVTKAEGLLLYLKRKPANVDEQMQNELLLKIFQRCIPAMPRVSSNFAVKLSDDLVPMISAPQGGYSGLKETIACFCAVANHLTMDYMRVMKVLVACDAKVRNMRNEWATTGKATLASAPSGGVFLYVCAGIAEGCNLDEVAKTDPAVESGLSKISPDRPLYEHMFESVLQFTKMPISQQAPSMCFGALFRAYPILILREEAAEWMDDVFKGHDEATQARLLTVIYDFLNSEAEKKTIKSGAGKGKAGKAVKQEGRGMDALIGNAAELSESGLSTAVVQRNIKHILAGAKSQHPQTQSAAMDILAFTVKNMLYHPIECMSILIALETSENERVAERALDLHHMLHNKHSTLVNVRFLEHTRGSYEYQRTLTAEVVGHRDGTALLQGWYSLLSEKRTWRNDFLKQICRILDYDISRSNTLIDVGLVLYICDNLTSLEYKLQEEVMTVVSALISCVSGATDLVMVLESSEVDGEAADEIKGKQVNAAKAGETYNAETVANASIVVGLAILTKNNLVDVYGVPEEKCAKHAPGKKTAFGDKPAVRRREGTLDTSRMAYVRGVRTVEEFRVQRAALLEMIHEDGSFEEL